MSEEEDTEQCPLASTPVSIQNSAFQCHVHINANTQENEVNDELKQQTLTGLIWTEKWN